MENNLITSLGIMLMPVIVVILFYVFNPGCINTSRRGSVHMFKPRIEMLPEGFIPDLKEGEEAFYIVIVGEDSDMEVIRAERSFDFNTSKYDGPLKFYYTGCEVASTVVANKTFIAQIHMDG